MKAGRIAAGNPPQYVRSVTYGRVVAFSLSSEQVKNARELRMLLDGATQLSRLDVEARIRYKNVLASSRSHVFVNGGPTNQHAEAALRNGTIEEMLANSPVTAPKPMTFQTAYLDSHLPGRFRATY
jgi:hypothetical protein